MKPETSFRVNKVAPFLKTLKNCAYFSIQQVAIVGDPDYMLCICGQFVALELKSTGNVPRPKQQEKLDWIRKNGGVTIVATPNNWEECKTLLSLLDQGDARK